MKKLRKRYNAILKGIMTQKGVITAFKQALIRFLKRRYIKLFFSFCGLILLKHL